MPEPVGIIKDPGREVIRVYTQVPVIARFNAEYGFLSNFYERDFSWNKTVWPSAEHAFQAHKTLDTKKQRVIQMADSARDARRLGRALSDLREDWDFIKVHLMQEIIWAKFHESGLMKLLIETAPAYLMEGNDWGDEFWGVGLTSGRGKNWLGCILMATRTAILED